MSFTHVATVPKVDPRGRTPRFWAVQDLAITIKSDCLFNETKREDLGDHLRYTFKGEKMQPSAPNISIEEPIEDIKKPKKESKKKEPRKKLTLLDRLKG